MPTDDSRPATKAALLDAAARLLAQRPPTEIPGRTLAAEAGVNYGLVHYFGGKDQIFAEAYEHLVRRFVDEITVFGTQVPDVRHIVEREDVWRAAANLAIDSEWAARYGAASSPIVEVFGRLVASRRPDAGPPERKARVAAVLSILLGWAMFEPLVTRGAGLEAGAGEDALSRLSMRVQEIVGADGGVVR
ncbi:hypothetical protein AXA44_21845 [Rhodococcus sp. SC4]|nr:hypothetical protein AXA44_21845 [Rhodococcus sp. SC4]